MTWDDPFFITEADLGIAYRKAKADLYYERTVPYLQAISLYEKKLLENLGWLFEQLHSGNLEWMQDQAFLGSWALIPKSITPKHHDTDSSHCLLSDPDDQWRCLVEHTEAAWESPKAEFRMVGRLSIDFHIISALWILKVGHVYDSVLGQEAYGSRLRRLFSEEENQGEINRLSLGTFKRYLPYYRQWREKGLTAMHQGLEDKKRVAAVTADLRLFYHSLSPKFLLDPDYLTTVGLEGVLTSDQKEFTLGLIKAIRAWAKETPLHNQNPSVGLPVGLSASRLIANVALAEFDKTILQEITPLYYGRYVDDVILVLHDTHGFQNSKDVWGFLENRMKGLLAVDEVQQDEKTEISVSFNSEYLGESVLKFMGSKQKVFLLKGASGLVLVNSIRRQINEQASEWRRLPEMEDQLDQIATTLLAACGDDGKAVDSLRKTDDLSISRAGFAICLRDFEAFEQDLEPYEWPEQRKEFFETVCRHFLVMPKIFDYAPYIPRLMGLAVACHDYKAANQILDRLHQILGSLEKDCSTTIAGEEGGLTHKRDILSKWQQHIGKSLYEASVAALTPKHIHDAEKLETVFGNRLLNPPGTRRKSLKTIFNQAKSWFFRDLSRRPFRMRYMPFTRKNECWNRIPAEYFSSNELRLNPLFEDYLWGQLQNFSSHLSKDKNTDTFPLAFLFPTRPFGVGELFMLAPAKITDNDFIQDLTLAFRGFRSKRELPHWYGDDGDILCVPLQQKGKIRFALGSLETLDASWVAAARAEREPDSSRYGRINNLVNGVIASRIKPNYLLLPELSVPARWFGRLSTKLAYQGISLVAGVDYLHHGERKKRVANQVWASLLSDFVGFPLGIIYRQDKITAALHEESALWQVAGAELIPLMPEEQKPVIRHANFQFAILICSELTNIEYRSRLRGKVDAILVPEWNKDTKSFSALVEATALDLHAYVIQCNDRKYGDSRIRGPFRENWQRDVVRIKGGLEDYSVTGEIEVFKLRNFQANHRSPTDGLFKPVPDGYQLDPSRRP